MKPKNLEDLLAQAEDPFNYGDLTIIAYLGQDGRTHISPWCCVRDKKTEKKMRLEAAAKKMCERGLRSQVFTVRPALGWDTAQKARVSEIVATRSVLAFQRTACYADVSAAAIAYRSTLEASRTYFPYFGNGKGTSERIDKALLDHVGWKEEYESTMSSIRERAVETFKKAGQKEIAELFLEKTPYNLNLPATGERHYQKVKEMVDEAWENFISDTTPWLVETTTTREYGFGAPSRSDLNIALLKSVYGGQGRLMRVPAPIAQALKNQGQVRSWESLKGVPEKVIETAIVLYGDGNYTSIKEALKTAKALEA